MPIEAIKCLYASKKELRDAYYKEVQENKRLREENKKLEEEGIELRDIIQFFLNYTRYLKEENK